MLPTTGPAPAPPPDLTLYYAKDPLLEGLPFLIFYGPSTTDNSTFNNSRIQAHLLSVAGFQCFPRLTISPTSPLYAAVPHLPLELQGDEVSRGLAVSLLSYFASIPSTTKSLLQDLARSRFQNKTGPSMFDEAHAAELVARMDKVDDNTQITAYLSSALSFRSITCLDVDISVPKGFINQVMTTEGPEGVRVPLLDESGLPVFEFGAFDRLVKNLGSSAFLPSSKLKRAPSRAPLGRSRQLSKDAKIALRREMCELVDTESNYIGKVDELACNIGASCHRVERSRDLSRLFPESLFDILNTSKEFFESTQSILDATEDEAIRDIEGDDAEIQKYGKDQDPTGASLIATSFLEVLPKLKEPYSDYLRLSCDFGNLLTSFLDNVLSPSSELLREIGEQRLRSLLIEPVQRLPRYNLIIDNILHLLPVSHPAVVRFLKARDMVKDICALDVSGSAHSSHVSKTLNSLVHNWPLHFNPTGRLLAAVDVTELIPPFMATHPGKTGILLLFSDGITILRRCSDEALTARGVMAEIDRPSISRQMSTALSIQPDANLRVSASIELGQAQITESKDGTLIHLTECPSYPGAQHFEPRHNPMIIKTFYLQGQYEGKAHRLSQDIALARIENRYTETLRDSGHWAMRIAAHEDHFIIAAAIYEDGRLTESNPGCSFAPVQVILGHSDIHNVTADLKNPIDRGILKLYVPSIDETKFQMLSILYGEILAQVECPVEEFQPVLYKQITLGYQRQRQELARYEIPFLSQVLAGLPSISKPDSSSQRILRPMSPVKMLSKMLGGQGNQQGTPSKTRYNAITLKDPPALPHPTQALTNTEDLGKHQKESLNEKPTVTSMREEIRTDSLSMLEDTFIAYVRSIRSQSGNVVGQLLRGRIVADELAVNEVYNKLLEDPNKIEMDAPIDVIFVAFEKFLRRAWRERMGPLVSPSAIQRMQSSMDGTKASSFVDSFKDIIGEMSPQNRRALMRTIKLLSDLLDASGSDADRGSLIASFSEALILTGNPHDYVHLLDRLVEDYDNLFDEAIERTGSSGSTFSSLSRTRSFNKGSHNSNNSSFRRRFGLGGVLTRENSKTEPESKVASLLRTWSKGTKTTNDKLLSGNTSKNSLARSKSTDTDPRTLASTSSILLDQAKTPVSTVSNKTLALPGTYDRTHALQTTVLEESSKTLPTVLKKKRRSSLSDLHTFRTPDSSHLRAPLQKRPVNPNQQILPRDVAQDALLVAPLQNENLPPADPPPPSRSLPLHQQKPSVKTDRPSSGDILITSSYNPQRSNAQISEVSKQRTGLIERTWPPNGNVPTSTQVAGEPPVKPRVKGPLKIRERLDLEQISISTTNDHLQNEIDLISKEMSTLRSDGRVNANSFKRDTNALSRLSTRLDVLSKAVKDLGDQNTASLNRIRQDLDGSLALADKRASQLEKLYQETNAENELLYERFNDELSKVLSRVRTGDGVDEMRTRLAVALKEAGSLRSEKAKLMREVVDLRGQVSR